MPAQEQWRPVPGFPDYEVSNLGRVLSKRRKKTRMVDGAANDAGYVYVWLCSDGSRTRRAIHRIVAEAFIGVCPESMEVRHLNGDNTNNALTNLAYGTHSENMHDQVRHGVHTTARRTHCPQGHPYDEANTYRPPSRLRSRYCRACMVARTAARRLTTAVTA